MRPGGETGNDVLLDRFLDYTQGKRLELYPAQETAMLELYEEKNVILNTPTGSGKSLVATALHFKATAQGKRSVYTCPIKALVNEKWLALCREFGPENVGLSTGDATVNREAPILCCTAEILANIALREGADARVDDVIMDEFHYYSDRDRGVAWQTPLLTLRKARFLLMSATIGETSFFAEALTRLNGKETAVVQSNNRPVPLEYSYAETPLAVTLEGLVAGGKSPVYVAHFTQMEAAQSAQDFTSVNVATKERESGNRAGDRRVQVPESVRAGDQEMAAAWDRAAPCGITAEISGAGGETGAKRPAEGDLRNGHAGSRDQRAHTDGVIHQAVQV